MWRIRDPRPQWDVDYIVEDLGEQAIPMFRDDMQRTFQRCMEFNARDNASQRAFYTSFFLDNGVVRGGRSGRTIGIPNNMDRTKWVLRLLSGATFVESLYDAIAQAPHNPYVIRLLADGFKGEAVRKPPPTSGPKGKHGNTHGNTTWGALPGVRWTEEGGPGGSQQSSQF